MSKFTDAELVLVHGRELPTLAGRLRLLHSDGEAVSIRTTLEHYVLGTEAVARAEITTKKGLFSATGTASATRDPNVVHALVETAESRAVARAARFASCGFEVGVEEVESALMAHTADPRPAPLGQINPGDDGGRRQRRAGPPMTSAQRRCIDALARRIHMDPAAMVARYSPGISFEDLDIRSASAAIDAGKRAAGTNGSSGAGGTNGEGR